MEKWTKLLTFRKKTWKEANRAITRNCILINFWEKLSQLTKTCSKLPTDTKTRKICSLSSKLTIKTPKQHDLISFLLTLNQVTTLF